jgi:protein TonB
MPVALIPLTLGLLLAQSAAPRTQAAPPLQAFLASATSLPVATFRVVPSYNADSSPGTTFGAVEIEAVVDIMGRVVQARVMTRLADAFDHASLEAIRRWRFRPAVRGKAPVASLIGVRFTFLPPKAAGSPAEVNAQVGLLPRRALPAPASTPTVYALKENPGMVGPVVIRSIRAEYSDAAMKRKVQGDVEIEILILPDGTVGAARVLKSLDRETGLDEQALISARYWLFEPATLNGQAVATTSTLLLSFRLY